MISNNNPLEGFCKLNIKLNVMKYGPDVHGLKSKPLKMPMANAVKGLNAAILK